MLNKIFRKLVKPNGISVLISAQNEESMIRLCVESFLCFADEIIIVTNGSTDNTIAICQELSMEYSDKVSFFDKPEINELYKNRAFALTKARYRWVMRADADYIAYTDEDGRLSIRGLRNRILQTVTLWPTAFWLEQVNISIDWGLTCKYEIDNNSINLPLGFAFNSGHMPRIYLNSPLLKFGRVGKNEGVLWGYIYKQVFLEQPYWFHCTFKSKEDLFLRTERRNWRELNNTILYPTLKDYFEKKVLNEKYSGMQFEKAKEYYFSEILMSSLTSYDENKYFPYPMAIKRILKK